MRAGELNHRLTLETATETANEFGEKSRAWVPVATVWASITAAPARIAVEAEAARLDVPVQVEVRYRTDLTAHNCRLVRGSTVYEIASPPVDPDGRRRSLRFLAVVHQHAETGQVVP